MTYGQYYRAGELVQLIHQNTALFGGLHPGYRAVHAYGRLYAGTFSPTLHAREISRAAHFATPVPVTVRFSGNSGDPEQSPRLFAMATKFYLPDGRVTDIIGITLPAFPANDPDTVLALLAALKPDPGTNDINHSRAQEFLGSHPASARVAALIAEQAAAVHLAKTSFRPLHAYRFVNQDGVARWARYHWEPSEGVLGQPPSELAKLPGQQLYDELDARLEDGPVQYRLELQLAAEGDPTADITVPWPEERPRTIVGHLDLIRRTNSEELGDQVMVHDPTRVTDGIEVSPDDAIMAVRRGVYEVSVAERTGGWPEHAPTLCPFARTPPTGLTTGERASAP